jgi:iron complex outermembrane receptor protein
LRRLPAGAHNSICGTFCRQGRKHFFFQKKKQKTFIHWDRAFRLARAQLRDGDHFNARFEGQYTGHQATSYDLNGTQNVGVIPGLEAPGTYNYYTGTAGSTTYNPNGGISPFAIFNLDLTYVMPVTFLGPVKRLTFDVNGHNIFNTHYFQYFFSQYQPTVCGNFTSGPFKGLPKSEYGGCTPAFNDGTPGEPAAVTFSVTARF